VEQLLQGFLTQIDAKLSTVVETVEGMNMRLRRLEEQVERLEDREH
jgi:hypothetical protein